MQKILYILGQLTDTDVEWLINTGARHKYETGQNLITQGRENAFLFILLEGYVSISVAGVGEVDVAGSGEILGEMSLVDARPPSATVSAIDETYALQLPHELLRARTEEDHGFGMRFYRAMAILLSQRLRSSQSLEFNEETGLVDGQEQEGELDAYVLDSLHVAGARFDRLLKKLMGARRNGMDQPIDDEDDTTGWSIDAG